MQFRMWMLKAWQFPWVFKAFACFAIGSYVWNWYRRWHARRLRATAETWPAVTGRVIAREIKERTQGEHGAVVGFDAQVTYSYFQDSQQSGIYRRTFYSNDEAGAWLDLLYDKSIQVRFDPSRPQRSTLLDSDLPPSPGASHYSLVPPIEGSIDSGAAMFGLDVDAIGTDNSRTLLAGFSGAGLFVCCVLHLMGLFDEPFGPGIRFGLLFAMQIYAIAIYALAYQMDRDKAAGITTALYKKQVDAVTPDGFKMAQKVLYGYSILLMGLLFYRMYILHQNSEIDPLPLFSAFQAMFLLDAYGKTQLLRWRAQSQNRVPMGD